uniref:Replication factor C subunit 4-like n=1 Tax=Nicotiana sylvestris TaxID=4096 RepID=A0A1U7V067_NICSY|nr:PREDICTED: replication factor C subunit 4-like [Nicotiana sylvestris]
MVSYPKEQYHSYLTIAPVDTAAPRTTVSSDLDGACSMVPPGTGKTTSILALAHELLVPNYKETVLELNASDDRNIERLIQMSQVNHGVKSPADISMDITRLIQTLNMSTTAFRAGVKLTLEVELASTS